ncbi:SusD family protein [bacterium A37T11]|nr:SusD family protein [bacterium A37T11]
MKIQIIFILAFGLLVTSCDDQWLEEKRDISLTVPSTVDDVRAILNNSLLRYDNVGLAELSGGEYELTDETYNSNEPMERNGFLWKKDIYEGANPIVDWDNTYKQVLQCNIALETLTDIQPGNAEQKTWNILYGEALFFRAKAFFNVAQLFTVPYDPLTLDQNEGIPLRLSADVNEKTTRASLRATYDQIVRDLTVASAMLDYQPLDLRQTSKPAAYAALARCYLVMREYEKAGNYADSSLQISNKLIDFNQLNPALNYPITPYNQEVILSTTLFPLYWIYSKNNAVIPTSLYDLYDESDLRKMVYFFKNAAGTMGFRGSYLGSSMFFQGSTTSEMLLIRAEYAARSGRIQDAIDDVNRLLEKRYLSGLFSPLASSDQTEALSLVLTERRKELIARGLHWQDLRRLNLEPGHEQTFSHTVGSVTYTLPPNDPRYVLPLPAYIVQATGISQNER